MLRISLIILVFAFSLANVSRAQDKTIKTFNVGSYQQILNQNTSKPFILAIWSIDCPSCLKDMAVLYQFHQNHPELNIVMLSTDEPDTIEEVKTILTTHKLDDLDNWIFGNDDAQKMRYAIDPTWYGELPRTYFFSSSHQRTGKSGALKIEEFEAQIADIKP